MRRLVIAGLAAVLLAPAAGAAPGFSYGVASGEITSTSALLWARSNERGPVRLHVWSQPRKGMPFVQIDLQATGAHDFVVQRRVHGLLPNRRYTYAFSVPARGTRIVSPGEFRTAPRPSTRRRSASRSAATRTAPAIQRPASRPTTASRSMAGWRPSATTSTSTSATRSTPTARSAASRPR